MTQHFITNCNVLLFLFQEHLSLSEITCAVRYSDEKTLGIFTPIRAPTLAPLQLKFSGDIEMETWQADIVRGKLIHVNNNFSTHTSKNIVYKKLVIA